MHLFVHRVAVWSVVEAALLLAAIGSGSALGQERPKLSVLGGTTLQVPGKEGENEATGYFSLLNPGEEEQPISVRLQAASSEKVQVQSFTPHTARASGATRVGVTFSGLDDLNDKVEGQLIIAGGLEPVAKPVEVTPALQPTLPWPQVLVFGSLAMTIFLALGVVGNMPNNDRRPLLNAAPGAKWTFSSWGTTLTGAGAIVGTALGQATFPEFPREIDKATVVGLNLLFGALVVVGPFIFHAIRRPKDGADQESGRWGWNLTLLIAAAITIWAVIGQLGAFALLCWELIGNDLFRDASLVGLFLIGLLAGYYFWVTTSAMVIKDWGPLPVAPAEPPTEEIDVSDVDVVHVLPGLTGLAVQREPEARKTLTLRPSGEAAPDHWSLL